MNKSTRILIIAFVVLLAIYFLFFRGKDRVSTDKVDEKIFAADSSKIEKIEIVKNMESITLEKVNGNWMVTKPVNYPADTAAIYPILSNLQRFTIESVASTNPAKFSNYLDSVNNTKVTVYQEGKQLGSFIIGKSASGGDNTYIMKPDEQKILIASNLTGINFIKQTKDFRDKVIMSIPSFSVNKIDFKSTDSNKVDFTMTKDSTGKWYIGKDSVATTTAEGFQNLFTVFRTDDFKDTTMTTFPTPTYVITMSRTGSQPIVINMYKLNVTPVDYIFQVSGKQQLFKFSEPMAAQYMKKKRDFIPEPPKTDIKTDTKKDVKTKK